MQKYFTRSLYADDKSMYADMMKYIRALEKAIKDANEWVNASDGTTLLDSSYTANDDQKDSIEVVREILGDK